MDLDLKGKSALVCGASSGLGLACARALASEGVQVVMTARRAELLDAQAESLRNGMGATIVTVPADITTAAGRDKALAGAAALPGGQAGRFDIVVTNAGGPPTGNFRDWDLDAWMQALNANMLSAIELMRLTVDGMIERRWGRIVNITSAAVKAPVSYLGLSNGARSGLTGFVAGLAREVAPHGVTINNLLPGNFDTERLRSNLRAVAAKNGSGIEATIEARQRSSPMGRFGDPDEFGAACAFLCGKPAAYITGQNLLIDGGAYPGTF